MDAAENFASRETLPPVRPGQNDLSEAETRVLGCLIEKQRTTPDQYPLTLNALRLACNQATNRDPVVDYDDARIREALHKLERRGFVRLASGPGSRAPKYRHLLRDELPMGPDEAAVMCVLMLRGAQTPGELKQRTERMHPFAGLAAIAQTLERLIARGLAQRLNRRPGQKEERFCELLTGEGEDAPAREAEGSEAIEAITGEPESAERGADGPVAEADAASVTAPAGGVSIEEFEELRARVERLEREVEALRVTEAGPEVEVGVPGGGSSELEVN
jgi:uncharacterized protein YceH (UPF0502 family)